MRTDRNTIASLCQAHGMPIREATPVTTGKFNTTYIASLAPSAPPRLRGQSVVLRIAPPDDAGFVFYERGMMAREPRIHRQVRARTSLPVPRIYVYDRSRCLIDRDYLIMEYMAGEPLSEVRPTTAEREGVMFEAGRYLGELHRTLTRNHGYGYPAPPRCMETRDSWVGAFAEMWNRLVDDLLRCRVYGPAEAAEARRALEGNMDAFDRDRPASLLHMDIWGQNILVEGGTITAIVDWDRALWGDPEIEFAVLDYCGFNNSAFWDGYGGEPDRTPGFRRRMQLYHLYEVQKYPVIWTRRGGGGNRVGEYREYCLRAIGRLT